MLPLLKRLFAKKVKQEISSPVPAPSLAEQLAISASAKPHYPNLIPPVSILIASIDEKRRQHETFAATSKAASSVYSYNLHNSLSDVYATIGIQLRDILAQGEPPKKSE